MFGEDYWEFHCLTRRHFNTISHMKFIFALTALMFLPDDANAITQGKFLGIFGLISIADRAIGHPNDNDPQDLFLKMKVTEKTQPQGRGKNIQTEGKFLNLTCSIRNDGQGNCSIVVKAGPKAIISPREGIIRYQEVGPAALELFKMFASDGRIFLFETLERNFRIESSPSNFLLEYRNI